MTTYSYLCDACGHETLSEVRGDRAPCGSCGLSGARRRYGFRIAAPFQDHFNQAVGAYVTNDRQFRDKLKRGSEEATLRSGIEHDFQPVDAGDREAFGITDEHLAALEPTKKAVAEHGAGILQ